MIPGDRRPGGNEENLVVTTDPRLLAPFGLTFDRLWARLAPSR